MKKGGLRKAFRKSRKLLLIWGLLLGLVLVSNSGINLNEAGAFDNLEDTALQVLVYLVRALALLLLAAVVYFLYKTFSRLLRRFS